MFKKPLLISRSVSTKLAAAFGAMIVLVFILGAFGYLGMETMDRADRAMYNKYVIAVDAIGNIRSGFHQQRVCLRDLLIYKSGGTEFNHALGVLAKLESDVAKAIDVYESTIALPEDRELFDRFLAAYNNEYKERKEATSKAASAGTIENANENLSSFSNSVNEVSKALEACVQYNKDQAALFIQSNNALFNSYALGELIVIIVCVLFAAVIALVMNRIIAKPLVRMARAADQIADGDMDVNIKVSSKDEVYLLAQAFKRMAASLEEQTIALARIAQGDLSVEIEKRTEKDSLSAAIMGMADSLNHIIREVSAVAGQVAQGANHISNGSHSMAQGASEQATAIEQLSSSIYEISLNTKENAKMAEKASELYQSITRQTQVSSELMNELMAAVSDIKEASSNISKIIKLINDISFQTNILSLNAAVEAANAGQHGRGFAVVAGEVRNLALKSAKAAADTDVLIENTIQKAQRGSAIADRTYKALTEITGDILHASQLIDDIARSSGEQSLGIDQINIGIDQVAQVISLNSATAEQSAIAVEEMAAQTAVLENLVASFKLREAEGGQAATPRQASSHRSRQEEKPVIILDDNEKY